jgi:hypothetical protein
LYEVIFPPEIIEEGYGDAYEEGDGEEESGDTERNYVMYNFSGGVNDLDNNGATFIPDSDGVANSALFFNGTAFLSRELNATEDGSYCFWIQAKKVQPAAIPFIVGNGCTSGYAINLEDDKNGGMLVTVLCGGVNTNITDSDYSLPINQWVHLCLVKTANDFSIYVNGELSTSGTSAFNPPFEGLTIGGAWGCNPTEQKGSFYGNIDDVFIANYALDDAGVKEVKSGKFK